MKTELTNKQVIQFYTDNLNNIQKSKELVDNIDKSDNIYLTHTSINPIECPSISIVMTTRNRQQQTYYTLQSIISSQHNKQIQIIIVDDSTSSSTLDVEKLKFYNVHIDYIVVKQKFWINPCVNYNIGFKFIKAPITIIQNAEVCHIGDVINYAVTHLRDSNNDNNYLVFDVLAFPKPQDNNTLYTKGTNFYKDDVPKNINRYCWYQHHTLRNGWLHFLSALKSKHLETVGGFDLDYCMGTCFDDNAFIDQLKYIKLQFTNVRLAPNTPFGIHQWHTTENPSMTTKNVYNQHLLFAKQKYLSMNKQYPFITNNNTLNVLFD